MLCPQGKIQDFQVFASPLFLGQKEKPGEMERRVAKRKRMERGVGSETRERRRIKENLGRKGEIKRKS